ncbi:MAG: efflux RND transporter permease subunit [Spirochaetota bacterium]
MKLNWTGKLTTIFVSNGKLAFLLLLTLFLWGGFSFFLTPKQYNPKIVAPAFQVLVEYPGASREEVLQQITIPLENIIRDIPQVEDIFSVTYHGGKAVLNVNFFVGKDFEQAKIILTDRINSRIVSAPLGIKPPLIRSIDPDDVPVLVLAISSQQLSPIALRRYAFSLRERLRQIEGVNSIDVVGGRKRELKVLIDPLRMAKSGVSINEIQLALQKQNLFRPAGLIKTPKKYIPIEVNGTIKSAEDLQNVVLLVGDAGLIRLKDVADVVMETAEIEEYVRHIRKKKDTSTKENVVLISLAKQSPANISDVTEQVEVLVQQKGFLHEQVAAKIIVNEGRVARQEISGLLVNLLQAIAIVVVILLVSLDFRAALLVGISIPLTLASVFGVGYIAGQNTNRITLFALILSLGLLVDSATVVIENIVRKLKVSSPEEGEKELSFKMRTIVAAVNEVGVGLFISTVTTVLAFLPMAFVTGMMGPYMGPIPFFVPTALVLALFITYTINPWLALVFLRSGTYTSGLLARLWQKLLAPLLFLGNSFFSLYQRCLRSLLDSAWQRRFALSLVVLLLLLSCILPAVALVKFRMLPKADKEQFFLYVDLPEGVSLQETLAVTKKLEVQLLGDPNVLMLQSYVGTPPILDFNGLFRGVSARSNSNQSTLRVALLPPKQRSVSSEELVMQIRPKLQALIAEQKGYDVRIKLVEDPPGPPVLSTLLLRIIGEDDKLRQEIAKDLLPVVNGVEEVVDTDTSVASKASRIQVEVNHINASQRRVNVADVINTLQTAYAGDIIGIYHQDSNREQEYIKLQMAKEFRSKKETLQQIFVYNALRLRVPLSELVTIREDSVISPLYRENNQNTSYVYGDMANRSITYAAIDLLAFLWKYKLPDGQGKIRKTSLLGVEYTSSDGKNIQISLGGEWELTLEVFRDLGLAMGVAVFLVYFVLVAQFGSFREPLLILSTIPLSLLGVLPGFLFLYYSLGIYFTATSMIGVIALAGIAVNNSIILLEYLNHLKLQNYALKDALLEAGITRFRPVMLTTITTVLGSLTIAGDPVWAGLAYAIIFGLGVSSILTLLLFPVLYYVSMGKSWSQEQS